MSRAQMTSIDIRNEAATLRAATELLRRSDDIAATDPAVAAELAHEAYQVGRQVKRVAGLVEKERDLRLERLHKNEANRRPLTDEVHDTNKHVRIVERVDRHYLPKIQRERADSHSLMPAPNNDEARGRLLRMIIRIMAVIVMAAGTVIALIRPLQYEPPDPMHKTGATLPLADHGRRRWWNKHQTKMSY